MTTLGARDLRAALEFALEVRATDNLESFRHQLVPGLRRLVACDTIGFNEIDLERGTADVVSEAPVFDGLERRFLELAHQHPLVAYQRRGDLRARLISDFVSGREFHRLDLYHDVYRRLGIEDQLALGLARDGIVAINLARRRRTFTERDRQLIELVRPHLALAYARVRHREHTEALIEALASELGQVHAAVIRLDARGRVSYATPATAELLHVYFGHPPDDPASLPVRLHAWVNAPNENGSPRTLTVDGGQGRLVVREHELSATDDARALILEERPAGPPPVDAIRSLGLTDRQAQVLRLLAWGKPTRQVASELRISADTVEKHLEHIYRRLGVNTRGQALARIYDAPPSPHKAGTVTPRPQAKAERLWPAADDRQPAKRAPARADLRDALGVALAAQATDSVQQLRDEMLPALRRLVGCDLIGYNEVDLERGTVLGVVDPAEGGFDGIDARFAAVVHQHPLVKLQQAGNLSTQALSDFLTTRQLHRLELYQDFYKLIDTEDQLAFGIPGETMIAFAFCRSKPGFTWRDRQLLEIVRPHLSLAYQHAREQENARSLLGTLEQSLEAHHRGVILLDSRGRVARATEAARELLDSYSRLSASGGDGLPTELKRWIAAPARPHVRPRQLTIDGPRGRLRIREQHPRRDGLRTLVLEEQRPRPPRLDSLRSLGLTDRQAQVMRLLSSGKTNMQIGTELHISPATVEKHLEHIYTRLGVATRAQAIARILR